MLEEVLLRTRLKTRVLVLAVIKRARKTQVACITNLKFGDANTRFFHRRVNARRKKFIERLKRESDWACTHEEKASDIQNYFAATMQHPPPREADFNWELLGVQRHDLASLDAPFTEGKSNMQWT